MGIYDRDYYRNSPPRAGFGNFVVMSVTTWLIVINIVAFFADGALKVTTLRMVEDQGELYNQGYDVRPITELGKFTKTGLFHLQLWRLITFQFLHASIGHIVGNMIALYFFGPIVEAHFGSRRYLAFYLLCGLAGALCYTFLSISQIIPGNPDTGLVGASAGIFGLLVAAAMIAPNVEIFYYFFPVTILTLAIIGMLVAIYTVFTTGYNAGGEAAHLGGGVLGFVLMRNQHWLNFAAGRRMRVSVGSQRPRRTFQKDWSKDLNR